MQQFIPLLFASSNAAQDSIDPAMGEQDNGRSSSTSVSARGDRRDEKSRSDRRERHESSRKRSASPSRRRSKRGEKDDASDGGKSDDDDVGPPQDNPQLVSLGAKPLTADDYYQRSAEYRHWLLHSGTAARYRKDLGLSPSRAPPEGGIYLDEITSKEAHRLFDKFCQRWNDGKLSDEYYLDKITSSSSLSSNSSTGYKWGFAAKRSEKEREEIERARDGVDSLTNSDSRGAREARDKERMRAAKRAADRGEAREPAATGANANASDSGWGQRNTVGPQRGHHTDARFDEEESRDAQRRAAQAARRADRRDARDIEEERNPRATGRDAVREQRAERNRDKRAFEAETKGDGDVYVSENDLMGGGDDFKAA